MKGVFFLAYIRGGATLEEKEISNIYAIPANYTDSGKLLGGMVEPRNAVETGFLLFLVGAAVDSQVRHSPGGGHDRHSAAPGGGVPHGGGRRLPVPVPGAHPPVLDPPAKTPL